MISHDIQVDILQQLTCCLQKNWLSFYNSKQTDKL